MNNNSKTVKTSVISLSYEGRNNTVPGIPCDNCGNLADQQVDGMGSDRYWYCDNCGEVSREGLNMIGEPIYPGSSMPEEDNSEWEEQTDINDYGGDGEIDVGVSEEDEEGDESLDRWIPDN